MINRRNFLKSSAAATLATTSVLNHSQNLAFAQTVPNDFKTIVCVYLDGGNDSFNMLIPNSGAEYNAYNQSRQGLALEQSALQKITPNGLGANSFGLHPNMVNLRNMFSDGDASMIANIGSLIKPTTKADINNDSAELPSRLGSHTTGRSYWKGDHDNSTNSSKTGIGGRIANEFINSSDLPMLMSINSGYDLFLDHPNVPVYGLAAAGLIKMSDFDLSLTGPFSRPPSTARRAALQKLNMIGSQNENLFLQHSAELLSNGLELSLTAQGFLENLDPINTEFPSTTLGNDLKRAAQMISIRGPQQLNMKRQIIYVQASGFDTHNELLGFHSSAMANLSDSLAAFNDAMKELDVHSSVLTYTASDFSRTLTNTGDGTDHAWGGPQILMGGGIKGGELFGSFPSLELDNDEDYNGDGRMIPSSSITQHTATIAKWFGVPQNRLSAVAPNLVNFSGQEDLGFFA